MDEEEEKGDYEEVSGEDLLENMDRDYQKNELLDRYERHGLDD